MDPDFNSASAPHEKDTSSSKQALYSGYGRNDSWDFAFYCSDVFTGEPVDWLNCSAGCLFWLSDYHCRAVFIADDLDEELVHKKVS